MQICLESDLIKPLIYICNHSSPPDFITPLMRMWSAQSRNPEPQMGELAFYVE
jgi:hypothetical protein